MRIAALGVLLLSAVASAQVAEPELIDPMHARLNWVAPTENVDGTPLTDLAGFKLYVGATSRTYDETIDLPDPDLTTYDYDGSAREPGDYFFALTAYDAEGNESAYSNEVNKTLQAAPTPTGDRPILFIE